MRGVAAGGFGEPHDQEVDGFVTLKHLFGIVSGIDSRDVAMKGNTISATIHGVDSRNQVRCQQYRRGRWTVVTHGTRRQDFVFDRQAPTHCLKF